MADMYMDFLRRNCSFTKMDYIMNEEAGRANNIEKRL